MANGRDVDPKELEFRRRWYEAHRRRAEAEPDYVGPSGRAAQNPASAAEAIAIRDRLAADGDLDRFRSDLQAWAERHGFESFRTGRWGMQFVGSLVKRAEEPAELAQLFVNGLSTPRDSSSAAQKIDALAEYAERFKSAGHMHPMNVRVLLPYFWRMGSDAQWPVLWWGHSKFMGLMTGEPWWENSRLLPEDWPDVNSGNFYLRYLDQIKDFDNDPHRFQAVASWWASKVPVFLDIVLVERCAFGMEPVAPIDGSDPSKDYGQTQENGNALTSISRYIGKHLVKDLADAVGRQLSTDYPLQVWGSGWPIPRPTIWIRWPVKGQPVALHICINRRGAFIGIRPVWIRRGWYAEAKKIVSTIEVEGFRFFSLDHPPLGGDQELVGARGEFAYGRWYKPDQLSGLDLRAEMVEVASAARPVIEALIDDPIGEAARELLVERSFLDDIVRLLEDKGQVILYGPPGTGKTYLAKRLAEALAPDSEFRALVQFHPSTSYEDFFEGYRPVPRAEGRIAYELTRGPLARMAAHAEGHSGRHVMVIDEINRANLPRVLGELLFLFEYRGERVSTLYRSDEKFGLPDSVWFVGTMNTADRSIALVDAALRRRFHFVAFFPGRGPTVGLLGRWLEREREPGWVDGLVKMVNDELTEAVGEDLQLGFSHFMRKGYGKEPSEGDETLRRIWRYSIEPFVEDQLFGDQERIKRFRFEKVIARYRKQKGFNDLPGTSDEAPSD